MILSACYAQAMKISAEELVLEMEKITDALERRGPPRGIPPAPPRRSPNGRPDAIAGPGFRVTRDGGSLTIFIDDVGITHLPPHVPYPVTTSVTISEVSELQELQELIVRAMEVSGDGIA